MSIRILGRSGKEAIPYAVKLGVALQLTNILRDVEDWRNGRLYLPRVTIFDPTGADIEANDYDVFSRRAHISDRNKLSLLPDIWRCARFGNYQRP